MDMGILSEVFKSSRMSEKDGLLSKSIYANMRI